MPGKGFKGEGEGEVKIARCKIPCILAFCDFSDIILDKVYVKRVLFWKRARKLAKFVAVFFTLC